MRFFATITALAFATAVVAQNSTTAKASMTTASLSPQQTCLANCGSADICCQAACVGVPCPSQLGANATTECAGRCVQGNGTLEETQAYASCQAKCVSSYFLSSTSGVAASTSGGSASATATFGASSSTSGSHSGTATATASGSTSSSAGNAVSETRAIIAGAGLFGLIIAGLAL